MILIGGFGSPFVRRTAITMQLYGIAYEHRALRAGDPDERVQLKAINPLARVPALECPKLSALSKRANALPEFAATRPPGF